MRAYGVACAPGFSVVLDGSATVCVRARLFCALVDNVLMCSYCLFAYLHPCLLARWFVCLNYAYIYIYIQGKHSTDSISAAGVLGDFVRCEASVASEMCVRLGRYQAKGRFPRKSIRPDQKDECSQRNECRLCCRTHVLCKRCFALVDDTSESKQNSWKLTQGLTHKVCQACAENGYTPHDTRTYECREAKCVRRGGAALFDAESVYNYNKGQLAPKCAVACGKGVGRKK